MPFPNDMVLHDEDLAIYFDTQQRLSAELLFGILMDATELFKSQVPEGHRLDVVVSEMRMGSFTVRLTAMLDQIQKSPESSAKFLATGVTAASAIAVATIAAAASLISSSMASKDEAIGQKIAQATLDYGVTVSVHTAQGRFDIPRNSSAVQALNEQRENPIDQQTPSANKKLTNRKTQKTTQLAENDAYNDDEIYETFIPASYFGDLPNPTIKLRDDFFIRRGSLPTIRMKASGHFIQPSNTDVFFVDEVNNMIPVEVETITDIPLNHEVEIEFFAKPDEKSNRSTIFVTNIDEGK